MTMTRLCIEPVKCIAMPVDSDSGREEVEEVEAAAAATTTGASAP